MKKNVVHVGGHRDRRAPSGEPLDIDEITFHKGRRLSPTFEGRRVDSS